MKLRLLSLIHLLVISFVLLFTTENGYTQEPAKKQTLNGEVSLGTILNYGNLEAVNVDLQAKAEHKIYKFNNKAYAGFGYNKLKDAAGKNSDEQKIVAGAQSDFDLPKNFYVNALADYENDSASGYNYRIMESVGLGYRFYNRDDLKLSLEAGPGLNQVSIKNATGGDDFSNSVVYRIGLNFLYKFANFTITEKLSSYIDGEPELLVDSKTELSTTLTETLLLKVGFDVRYLKEPPAGKETTDLTTRIALAYKF